MQQSAKTANEKRSELVRGVSVAAICVTDLERAARFCVETLGLRRGKRTGPGWMIHAGEFPIYVEGGRESSAKADRTGPLTALCFDTPSVKAAFEQLQIDEIEIVDPYTEFNPEFAMFRIADPDGNVVEFTGAP